MIFTTISGIASDPRGVFHPEDMILLKTPSNPWGWKISQSFLLDLPLGNCSILLNNNYTKKWTKGFTCVMFLSTPNKDMRKIVLIAIIILVLHLGEQA